MNTKIKELAISGGGVKGIAFLGALYQMDKYGLLKNIEKIAGTSIGSFIATCLIIGYKPGELLDIIFYLDLNSIKDINLKGIFKNKGIMKAENYRKFIKEIIEKKINPNITLIDLYKKTGKELIICVSCLNTRTVEYISYKNNPDLELYTLILMSSAIPGFLPPVLYKNKMYIDGGILDNIPLSQLSKDAWGICPIEDTSFIESESINFVKFFLGIHQMIVTSLQKEVKLNHKNIILIDTKHVEVTSFNVTYDDKITLIYSGINAVKKIFNHNFLT
jgi:NTE family protein